MLRPFILGTLLLLLLVLQYALWLGDNGFAEHQQLQQQIQQWEGKNQQLKERNARLIAEISDLKNGLDAIEARARLDLGLVKPGEQYISLD
ncbi:cell division protein FtsB [Candidatus Venteria ishoeyi]|uniref:Cell division protein FtsB n=1 Tax=Candidatus Venteria ishoeyi TaxID=1899563 RepID=A0A1H6FFX8_9GAMM|nr:cell division protein FtsB [Candidatus Venteria ishoeyi]MDM8546473.1 cell division protein FtsB [Candidatus Venteria ishoeyi]SEH08076.1 Cell division protein FtsB [Candidatus Venteria ishoeyi]